MQNIKSIFKKILPKSAFSFYHLCMAFLACMIYRYPSKKIKVIGVTGTNGKSTVVRMISEILKEAGFEIAVSSSVYFQIREKSWPNDSRMTMPGRFSLQKLLRQAVSKNCQYVVVEVSSEGIKQHRHRFIDFEAVIITNVTPEHLEAHGGFENYLKSKGELFRLNKNIHIINSDDDNFEYFLNFKSEKKYLYSLKLKNTNKFLDIKKIATKDYQCLKDGSVFYLDGVKFRLNLLGKFNIYNALAAVSLGLSQNISLNVCKNALNKIKIMPGRMEQIISAPYKVFVDYAVTPDSLEKAYQTLKTESQKNKLICVLGSCGGGRDKWKRPILGKLASKYCDQTIITNEDPYDEDPMAIINEIAKNNTSAKKMIDRRKAIAEALKSANKDDVVIITGKGSENSMCLADGKKINWNDKNVVLEEFKKIFS